MTKEPNWEGAQGLGGDVLLNLMLDHSESLRRRDQTGTRDELRSLGRILINRHRLNRLRGMSALPQ
jgi:hypothetical protein